MGNTPADSSSTSTPSTTTYASVVLLMGLGGAADTAYAAVDGELAAGGAASSGRIGISLVIPERVEVQGMQDIALAQDVRGVVRGETTGCVFGRGSGQYSVAALGAGLDHELAFTAGKDAPQVLTMGAALRRLEGAGARGCPEGANNARIALRVKTAESDLNAQGSAQTPKPKSGALTLLIAPE